MTVSIGSLYKHAKHVSCLALYYSAIKHQHTAYMLSNTKNKHVQVLTKIKVTNVDHCGKVNTRLVEHETCYVCISVIIIQFNSLLSLLL